MNRVRLIDIYNGRFDESSLKLSAAADIEVVPRKMVEMIIEYCLHNEAYYKSIGRDDIAIGLCIARDCAESLLKQFEEEDEEDELDFEITAEDLHDYMYGI